MARPACVLLVLSLAGVASSEERPPAEVLTLDQAVALAVQANRSIRNATLQVDRSENNVGAARARRWPQLDLPRFRRTVQI